MKSVLIIGGGVIGASIAYHLVKQDPRVEVTLVEQGDAASGSSGACDGLVFMQSKKPGIHLELALESRKGFRALQKELPLDIEYRETGGMVVIENQAEFKAMERFTQEQQAIGLDVSLLDRDQALTLEPELASTIAGATHSPQDAQVNPITLTLGLIQGARQNGARILIHTRILAIETSGSRVTGVMTDKGRFTADVVVMAGGALTGELAKGLDLDFPIRPRRGQIVVTQASRPLLSHCMISASYIAAKFDPALAAKSGQGISMEQADNGNLLLGSTREFAGFDRRNTPHGLKTILRKTAAILPAIRELDIIRTFAGLRPFTPDGMPLLGPVAGFEGLYTAAGHEGDGIALSPVTGALMADLILGRPSDLVKQLDIQAFSPNRFLLKSCKCSRKGEAVEGFGLDNADGVYNG